MGHIFLVRKLESTRQLASCAFTYLRGFFAWTCFMFTAECLQVCAYTSVWHVLVRLHLGYFVNIGGCDGVKCHQALFSVHNWGSFGLHTTPSRYAIISPPSSYSTGLLTPPLQYLFMFLSCYISNRLQAFIRRYTSNRPQYSLSRHACCMPELPHL